MIENSVLRAASRALSDELFALSLYSRLAKRFRNDHLGTEFSKITEMEKEHVLFWDAFLKKRGCENVPTTIGKSKLLVYNLLLKVLGHGLTLRLMERKEVDAIELYSQIIEDPSLGNSEVTELKQILEDELVHEHELTSGESRFENFLTYVKDAVLGMNDGLVEILSVTTGLAGAFGNPFQVALGGFIVGISGALSMGISTYTSVRTQRQVNEDTLRRIVNASRFVGHLFKERIADLMQRKGYSEQVSTAAAEEASKNHQLVSEIIAFEEHGVNKATLGKPSNAALYAGSFNALGAFVPLLPYLFSPSILIAVLLSLTFAGGALALTASLIAVLSNSDVKKRVIEMVVSGLGSALASYTIGRAVSFLLGISSI